ncbi:MAG: hypothetical protein ACKVP2_08900 [Burkholderiales bacterium]
MFPRKLISLLIVPFLLFAQLGATAHAVSHAGKEAPANEKLLHTKYCGTCFGFEKLFHSADVVSSSLPELAGGLVRSAAPGVEFQPQSVITCRSRGPPVSL